MTVERIVETTVPTDWGDFRCGGYVGTDGVEHVALVRGEPAAAERPLVRLHSECFTGDIFGSHRCDCGPQLHESMRRIVAEDCGVLIYLRGHEGRGIGLIDKLRAYRLQDLGFDTVDANTELGVPVDVRDYHDGSDILTDLGVTAVRLLTNNPAKSDALADAGVDVVVEPLVIEPNDLNRAYLDAKRSRLGHSLPIR